MSATAARITCLAARINAFRRDSVAGVMDVAPKSELLERAEERREATYLSRQREPLGASYVRGHAIPPQLLETGFGKPGEVTSTSLPRGRVPVARVPETALPLP